jgi:serine/threonine protein kinase|tara:strand:- start:65 stop:1084 length:1020 start_codon:yes stop_codon:yes gene_type:complete
MKLLLENWRRFINEETSFDLKNAATVTDPGSPKARESVFMTRVKETTNKLGFHYVKKLGKGQMGEVFLVENKETGERNAMKVVTHRLYGGPQTSEREAQNYRFAMENKASMPGRYAKYLPDVYEVVNEDKDYYIFMEVLQDIPERVKTDLFRLNDKDTDLSRHEKYDRIFKDPDAAYDVITGALFGNIILAQGNQEVMKNVLMNVPNKVLKKIIDSDPSRGYPDTLADLIVEESMEYLKQDPGWYDSLPEVFRDSLVDSIERTLEKQIIPIHQGHGSVSHAGRSPESIEKLFPEARGLMSAMRYFHNDQKWQPKDVHSGNVMVRPGTKNFVITDLGLFD